MVTIATGGKRRWLSWRTQLALVIAVAEGIVVALSSNISRWTVIGLAIVAVAIYALVRTKLQSRALHGAAWIFAFSQILAVIVTILAWILTWVALALVVIFAVLALVFLLVDRR